MRRFARVNATFRNVSSNPSLTLSVDITHHPEGNEWGFTIPEWLEELEKVKKLWLPSAHHDDWFLSYFVVMDVQR